MVVVGSSRPSHLLQSETRFIIIVIQKFDNNNMSKIISIKVINWLPVSVSLTLILCNTLKLRLRLKWVTLVLKLCFLYKCWNVGLKKNDYK